MNMHWYGHQGQISSYTNHPGMNPNTFNPSFAFRWRSYMPPSPPPHLHSAGNWYQSCTPASYDNYVLSAYCGLTYQNGTKKLSTVNLAECGFENYVTAQYGTLQCAGATLNLPGETSPQLQQGGTSCITPRCK